MERVFALIDRAAEKCGSYSALADAIGISRHHLSDMRAGRRWPAPEQIAALCDVTQESGELCRELTCEAIAYNPKNEGRRARLMRSFFGCLGLGVALALQPSDAIANSAGLWDAATRLTIYTLSRIREALRALRAAPLGASCPHLKAWRL